MRMRLLLALLVLPLLLQAAEPTGNEDKAVYLALERLNEFQRVTDKPFKMDRVSATACEPLGFVRGPHSPHHDAWCQVYVNKEAADILKAGKGDYPAGTVIVKQKFAEQKSTRPTLYTVMRKMKPGYDSEHGDWEYSVVNDRGTLVLSRGKTDSCIECHAQYKDTDYVTRLYMK